jgi:hypothetical protein
VGHTCWRLLTYLRLVAGSRLEELAECGSDPPSGGRGGSAVTWALDLAPGGARRELHLEVRPAAAVGHDRAIRLARGEGPELFDLVVLGIHREAAAGALSSAMPPVRQRDPDGASGEEFASHRVWSLGVPQLP